MTVHPTKPHSPSIRLAQMTEPINCPALAILFQMHYLIYIPIMPGASK